MLNKARKHQKRLRQINASTQWGSHMGGPGSRDWQRILVHGHSCLNMWSIRISLSMKAKCEHALNSAEWINVELRGLVCDEEQADITGS